jgi:hypothetical protein
MPDASRQDALTKELSGAPAQNLLAPGRTRFILPALSEFILKNDKMPLLKRINSASGVVRCQEKSAPGKRCSRALKPQIL